MVDVHRPEQRSANMRAIRHKDTAPEIQIRKLLFAKGLRFRLHVKSLPGSPDLVLAKYRVVVFVHGCFWHGHHCHLFRVPATRTDFWMEKIGANRSRDCKDQDELIAKGWRVLTIWECALKGKHRRAVDEIVEEMVRWIREGKPASNRLVISHL